MGLSNTNIYRLPKKRQDIWVGLMRNFLFYFILRFSFFIFHFYFWLKWLLYNLFVYGGHGYYMSRTHGWIFICEPALFCVWLGLMVSFFCILVPKILTVKIIWVVCDNIYDSWGHCWSRVDPVALHTMSAAFVLFRTYIRFPLFFRPSVFQIK